MSSVRSWASTSASSRSVKPALRTRSVSSTRIPPSPMAPNPSSGWNGKPSLRTTMTSSGAPRERATSAATGTPPLGSAKTTGCSSRRGARRSAKSCPASRRSRKVTMPSSPRTGSSCQKPVGNVSGGSPRSHSGVRSRGSRARVLSMWMTASNCWARWASK